MKPTDSEIQQAVLKELKWDTRVEETDIGVTVDDGIVTLTGTVSSWGKRMAAQEAAHRVGSVRDVANDINVKIPGGRERTDTDLARSVRNALEWDDFVPDARIRSTVSNGWVTLEGEVDFLTERDDAEHAVRNLSGVRGIINKVSVDPRNQAARVREVIEDALRRRVQRDVKRIGLVVHDGKVDLSGTVHSWADRQAVVGAARGTPGVRSVEDHLRVEPNAA